MPTEEPIREETDNDKSHVKDNGTGKASKHMALVAKTYKGCRQKIPDNITPTTSSPATRVEAMKYPDRDLWAKSLNADLDKVDANEAKKWLNPADLNFIPKSTKIINMAISFNYKRNKYGSMEERKSRPSVRGDQMFPNLHYDPECTYAPMVGRIAVRMVTLSNTAGT